MTTINQMKILLELQALQSFSNSSNLQSGDSSTLFQELLEDALQSASSVKSGNNTANLYDSLSNSAPININYTVKNPAEKTIAPKNIEAIIQKASEQYSLPPELIKSIIHQESSFQSNAVSNAGAAGLMQLMPSTAESLGVTDVFDPEQNVMAGSKYLKNMLDRYNGDIELALAAYNAGPGNVDRYGGIPPFKETQNYVKKITDRYYS
ncbi:lytic transglycosylase domain-containing protein [Heyndrickxia sp. NPDC080065]|uniref:lytic transglycosylase domain-containing protein n=1 Tax=Heyndrickxia sp. NPDC080065 TaxID=3390568 RepID=UPI003D01E2A3